MTKTRAAFLAPLDDARSDDISSDAVPISPAPPDVFVARQPIFQRNRQVYGYELLYRVGTTNAFDGTAPDVATARVIANAFLAIGGEKLLNGKRAFINFDATLLTLEFAAFLPARSAVIEILEQTAPTANVLAVCRELKKGGYTLALDGATKVASIDPWVDVVDVVKVDARTTDESTRTDVVRACKARNLQTVAAKLETQAEFDGAVAAGYDYYQGYFFAKPTIVAGRTVPETKLALLQLLREVTKEDVDFDRIETVLECNAALVYKLLRYVNSALFARQVKIESVRQAMLLLGQEEFRKWICLLLVAGMGNDAVPELLVKCLVRARFAELLAPKMGSSKASAFLLGLLSHLDALLRCPMEEALAGLNLEEGVSNALLGHSYDKLGYLHTLLEAYETGDLLRLHAIAETFHLSAADVRVAYFTAVDWADKASKAEH